MAKEEHLRRLKEQGVDAWNDWRAAQKPGRFLDLLDLSGADLREASLGGVYLGQTNLSEANLSGTFLERADFAFTNLSKANLSGASLTKTTFLKADLPGADLSGAFLHEAVFVEADLSEANLAGADLRGADLSRADLRGADLSEANLVGANLGGANLTEARLIGANLISVSLVGAYLAGADLTNCRIYGLSAWGLSGASAAKQQNLIITPGGGADDEPEITVDNIEVAQFIYLLLHNEKIRDVIETITSKAVLILGRFTDERKAVLDVLRDELRKRDYLPILFDFDKPASKDLTGTVTTLANMARFVIADGTDPKSIPHELATIVPTTIVPVQPILLKGEREYAMFGDLQRRYHWVLPTYRYECQKQLIVDLDQCVIRPAAEKAKELRKTVAA